MSMNPVATWRRRKGLNQTEAALALGVSSNSLGLVERGDPGELYPSIVDGLRAIGEDEGVIEDLRQAYRIWREAKVAELRRQAAEG